MTQLGLGSITKRLVALAGFLLLASACSSKGDSGSQGSQGPEGPVGPAGPAGPAGPTGAAGPQGAQGLPGAQGPAGPAGATGATGPQGPIGATGLLGPAGPAGPAGPTGSQGPTGAAGAQGPAGPAGPAGPGLVSVTFAGGDMTAAIPKAPGVCDAQSGVDFIGFSPGRPTATVVLGANQTITASSSLTLGSGISPVTHLSLNLCYQDTAGGTISAATDTNYFGLPGAWLTLPANTNMPFSITRSFTGLPPGPTRSASAAASPAPTRG